MALNFPQLEGKRNHARELELRQDDEGFVSRLLRLVSWRLWPGQHEGFQPFIMFLILLSVLTMWVADSKREENEESETAARKARHGHLESKRHVPIWDLR